MRFFILFMLAATSALAQEPAQKMDAEAFDTFSRGWTLYFKQDGQFYGSEQYFSDHRTVWRANDGSCVNGKWAFVGQEICFSYDNGDGPYCWVMERTADGLTATSRNSTEGAPPLVLALSGQDHVPILCTGPLFGV